MKRPEQQIQKAVFKHLHTRPAPRVFAFHPPNGGKRGIVEASIFKSMGVIAGVPDIIAIKDGKTFALELKAENARPPSVEQIGVMQAMQHAGATVALAVGLDQALQKLEEWGLLSPNQSVQKGRGD